MQEKQQDKQKEIAFFDGHAADDDYDVFTPEANARLVATFVELSRLRPPARVADLGCGSGTFTARLERAGYDCVGLDISAKLIAVARRKYPEIEFAEGDIEQLPFPDASFDGVLLSGVVHHFPDPSRCAAEVFRVLRPGGRFVAFDPNRMNPFMWLYRDRASPFYSSLGVTANERPVLAREVAPCSNVPALRCRRTISPGLPTATWRRRGRATCCRSTILSTRRCSACVSWNTCALSC